MKAYPLSETQLGMFLAWNENRQSTQYSIAYLYRLPKAIDADRLEQAFRTVLDAYPVFRTRFAEEGGIFDLPKGVEILSPETATVKAPLTALVTPGKDDFELVLEYDRSMNSEKDMTLLVGMFARLAENATGEAALSEIPLLTPEETARTLAVSKGDAVEAAAAVRLPGVGARRAEVRLRVCPA